MQIISCAGILILTITIYYLLGRALCAKCAFYPTAPEMVCIGFFFYYAVFQIIAQPMIFTKQKLHILGNAWLAILLLLIAAALVIIYKDKKTRSKTRAKAVSVIKVRPSAGTRLLMAVMAAAILCECASALLMQRNIGWDFTYYIGNMVTSAATDTMYLYDGSSGILRKYMDMRYALSSFYMNTAWISRLTGISALLLQKYVTGMLCVLLTNAIAYSFAMEVFRRDRKKTAVLVTITVLLTIFWDVYDTSAQFLMLRNYEAKAYCANVVLPMIVFLLYRVWKNEADTRAWLELFLTAFASVAVSMSSLVLVPALLVLMMLAHMLVERRLDARLIRRTVYCLLPNLCSLLLYFGSKQGWFVIKI